MWQDAGAAFAKKAREELQATEISIQAQMGPITVTLSDNGMLQRLEYKLAGKIESIVRDAIQYELGSRTNTDGSPRVFLPGP